MFGWAVDLLGRVDDDVRALAHALLVDGRDGGQVGGALAQSLDEEVQLLGGLVVVDGARGPLDDRHVEDLLHPAVEAGHALQVEVVRRLVDHSAVRDRVRSDWNGKRIVNKNLCIFLPGPPFGNFRASKYASIDILG